VNTSSVSSDNILSVEFLNHSRLAPYSIGNNAHSFCLLHDVNVFGLLTFE